MYEGLALTAASLLTAAGNLATHYPRIKSNHAPLRPRREQAVMVLTLLLAGGGFLQPGIAGYLLGGAAILLALFVLLGTATSCLPEKKPAVTVGAIAPDFTATDADGHEFRLSDLRGWRIQLVADPTLAIHRLYNVQSRKFSLKRGPFRDLAIPTTILIDKEGRVLWLEQTTDFRVRPQADMILAKAKAKALLPSAASDTAVPDTCDVCAAYTSPRELHS